MINQGHLLSGEQANRNTHEFSVFSQFGKDGVLQYLMQILEIKNQLFIEFGVEDFTESNCRFLMMNDNWCGFVIDGSNKNISRLRSSYYFWKYDLNTTCTFIDQSNINELLAKSGFDYGSGVMSIDLDGIDFFILASIKDGRPRILICKCNPLFGPTAKVTVPYDPTFQQFQQHHSGLYCGASLLVICSVAKDMGYVLVDVNSAGHNAFFVR